MNIVRPKPLVIDRLQRISGSMKVQADLHLGGHPITAIFDFARPGFVEYVTVPWLLRVHDPSLRAVVDTLVRFEAGEHIELPTELSPAIGEDARPSPFAMLDPKDEVTLCKAADNVLVVVEELAQSGKDPVLFSGRLRVDELPIVLRVELYHGKGRIPVVRWLQGSNPERLSSIQQYAIKRLLVQKASAPER
jgi:hypothetical protein